MFVDVSDESFCSCPLGYRIANSEQCSIVSTLYRHGGMNASQGL